jgi:hypothetical protein
MGLVLGLAVGTAVGCGDDDDDGLDNVGQSCEVADDCYPDVDHEQLSGEVICLDQVKDGYCTHHCETDADCCAVDGECDYETDLDVVCAPFQSTGEKYCFIACEGEGQDDDWCQTWAHPDFICRSTGGGALNRRVCVPEG